MKQKPNVERKARKWAAVGCVLAGLTVAAVATPVGAMAASKKGAKPNIVLINMDNFGYGELGVTAGVFSGVLPRRASTSWPVKGFGC